jgi:pimeloyl-ACP methyl ester carboxylesterase
MRIQQLTAPPVAVRTSAGEGSTIVFIHGNSLSSRAFARQFEGPLGGRHRLLGMDLPGHGDSARAREPEAAYTLPGYARALVEMAKQLDAANAVFVGWSLGGYVLLEAIPQLSSAAGFVIVGAAPVASAADLPRALGADPALGAGFREEATDEELRAWMRLCFRPGAEIPSSFVEDYHRSDPRTRSSLAASVGRNELADESQILARLTRPIAVIAGRHDTIAQRGFLENYPMPTLWRGAVQEIADAGHTPQWETPNEFDRLLADFVADCTSPR